MNIKVPLTGSNVKHEGNPLGQPIESQTLPAAAVPVAPTTTPADNVQGTAAVTKTRDPFQGRELIFNKSGQASWVSQEKAATLRAQDGETVETPAETPEEAPAEVPEEAPAEETPTAPLEAPAPPSGEAQLQQRINQLEQILTAVITSQAEGKSLAEVLGTAKQAEPDYSQIDLYEPQQLASFIQQTVQGAIKGAIEPHMPTIHSARQNQELKSVESRYSKDPNYSNRVTLAQQFVEANPGMSMENAYKIASHAESILTPQQSTSTNPATPPSGVRQQATRTISAEEAAKKKEQAQRLPKPNSGASGASQRVNPPPNMKGLGDMMAWNNRYNRREV